MYQSKQIWEGFTYKHLVHSYKMQRLAWLISAIFVFCYYIIIISSLSLLQQFDWQDPGEVHSLCKYQQETVALHTLRSLLWPLTNTCCVMWTERQPPRCTGEKPGLERRGQQPKVTQLVNAKGLKPGLLTPNSTLFPTVLWTPAISLN